MTTDALTLIVLLVSTAVLMIALAVATVFFAYRAPVKGFRAQARTAHFVFRYDLALELQGIHRFTRKSRTAELRQSIADAAADGGVRAALSRFGDPKELAREENARRRTPAWGTGGIFAVVVGLAFQFAIVVGLDVLSRGVERLAIPDASLKVSTFFLPGVTYDITTDHTGALDVMGTTYNALVFLVPVLVFLVVSRSWRLITARRAAGF